MAYATYQDIFRLYPPISTMVGSDVNEIATLDISSVYVYTAEGIMNAYLGSRYVTPLQADPLVLMIATDLALYKMMQDKLPRIPEFAERRYNYSIDMLEKLRDGKMVLGSSQTTVATGDHEAWSSVGSYHPVFSPVLEPIDQRVDDDYVTAEIDARSDDA